MARSAFSEWIEKQYLNWQLEHGRASLRQFSEWLGVNHALVSQWMTGNLKPGPKTLPRIAARLGPGVYDAMGIEPPDDYLSQFIRFKVTPEQREAVNRGIAIGITRNIAEGVTDDDQALINVLQAIIDALRGCD